MNPGRPIVMSIAGFDPSGGAGILADIKTFEQLNVQGFGVMTANTIQNDKEVVSVKWIPIEAILEQMDILLKRFEVGYFKIGIIENSEVFTTIKKHIIQYNPEAKIVWDPILKSSSGFTFFKNEIPLKDLLELVYLVTPNLPEFEKLFVDEESVLEHPAASNVFLKGGHSETRKGFDHLYSEGVRTVYSPGNGMVYPKHGSGCVLSSAITAFLAKEYSLPVACREGKKYTEQYLSSGTGLLGSHNLNTQWLKEY